MNAIPKYTVKRGKVIVLCFSREIWLIDELAELIMIPTHTPCNSLQKAMTQTFGIVEAIVAKKKQNLVIKVPL
jgi:hypothetical protein